MSDKFDCPHCGQDLRLGPDAFQRLAEREKEIERLRGALEYVVSSGESYERVQEIAEAALGEKRHLGRRDEGEGA